MSFHFLFFVLLVSTVFSDLCCKDVREPEVLVILIFTGVCVYIVCSEWAFSSCKVIRAKLDWAAFLSFLFLFFFLIMSKMLLDLFHIGLPE